MPSKLRLCVAGAGMIGRRHIDIIRSSSACQLNAIVDPSADAAAHAKALGVAHFTDLGAALAAEKPDGAILATPNQLHAPQALACIAAGVPVLIEKPVAHSLEAALDLEAAAARVGAKIVVGHHRQHGSVMAKAVEIIGSGALGRIVAIVGTALFYKAESEGYFDGANAWRREPGGGPVMINMIHEVGNMRALAGDIAEVSAFSSNATRGFAVEDTVAIGLRFAQGALGTFCLSDAAASDRSWEHTSGEDVARFGRAHSDDADCYFVTGTGGSLAIPTMRLSQYPPGARCSWHEPLVRTKVEVGVIDPLAAQIDQFCKVIRGAEPARVSLRDGVENMRVVDAILRSAKDGRPVKIGA